MNDKTDSAPDRELLTERLRTISMFGSQKAGGALGRLLNLPVLLAVPRVDFFPPESIINIMTGAKEEKFIVSQHLYGDVAGDVSILFPNPNTPKIADRLLGREPGETTELGALELSALFEVANIIVGSFLTVTSIATNMTFLPSVPFKGLPEKVVTFFNNLDKNRDAIYIEFRMDVEGLDLEADFVFVAEDSEMKKLIKAINENVSHDEKLEKMIQEVEQRII